jgi:hypothetical protein
VTEKFNSDEFKDVLQRIMRAKRHVEGWKKNIARWRKLYDMNHYNTKPKAGEIQYSDPTYTNTVDLAVGIMLANRLRWHAFGFTPSKQEQIETSQIEKLLDGTLMVNNEREEANQLYQLYLHFTRDGGGAIYSVFDPDIAEENKMMREKPDMELGSRPVWAFKEIPLRVQVIDPEAIFALPGGPKRWLMIGRSEQRSVLDIETIYGVRLEKFGYLSDEQKSTTFGEFIDAWDFAQVDKPIKNREGQEVFNEVLGKIETAPKLVVRNTVIFEGQAIFGPREMEGYKDLPYTIQFFKPTSKEPGDWHSILSPLESSVALLERTFNRRAHQIDVFTSLPIVSKTQPGRAVKIDPGLYNHVQITPDESIEFPAWQGNPPDINFHIEFLRSRIQQSGFSDVMFGAGASQVAGYALSQLGDQNRIRMEQPITHLELLLTHWAKKSLALLGEFAQGAQICVYGQHKGKDYLEYVEVDDLDKYAVRAEIIPEYPNEETRKTAMATQVKGTLSDYTIMERYLGIDAPEDEQERRIIEMVANHPVTIQYSIMRELSEQAEAGDEIAAQVLQQMQAGMIPGAQPGRPKEARGMEQLTGTQSPDGQPVPQAEGEQPGASPMDQLNNAANAAPNMDGGIG